MEWPGVDGPVILGPPSRARTFPARPSGRDEPVERRRERADRLPRPSRVFRAPQRGSTLDTTSREGFRYLPRRPKRVGIVESDGESVRESSRERDGRNALHSRTSSFQVRNDGRIEEFGHERDERAHQRIKRELEGERVSEDGMDEYPAVVIDAPRPARNLHIEPFEDESDEDNEIGIYDFALPNEGLASPDVKTAGLTSPDLDPGGSEAQTVFDSISSATVLTVDRSEYTGECSIDGDHGATLHDVNRGRSPLFRWMLAPTVTVHGIADQYLDILRIGT